MSSSNTSAVALQSDYSTEGMNLMSISNMNQSQSSLHGPVSILWDIENCPVPSGVRPEDVAGNIRMALRVHPVVNGAVTMFSAYGDFNAFPRRLREGCQRTGVKLIDVPNGRKDAADKAILVDMFLFALDNRPPSSIMLISGDIDFAPALHILGQRGYTVMLVIPSRVDVSSALINAGRFVWDWPSVARGEGFVPPAKASKPLCARPTQTPNGCQVNDCVDGEESILYKGISKEVPLVSHSLSEYSSNPILTQQNPSAPRSNSLPSGLNEVSPTSSDHNDLMWVQPGDLNGLKSQLVKLLETFNGTLPLSRLPAEYQKMYARPLYVSEFGGAKLMDILKKMVGAITIEGKGQWKIVSLCNTKPCPSLILAKKKKKGKGAKKNTVDKRASSDEISDDDKVAIGGYGDKRGIEMFDLEITDHFHSPTIDHNLKKFRYELQEILVSYSYHISLGYFEAIYHQRYKRQLDYLSFGVNGLEELLEKVKDVVVVQEVSASKQKVLVAAGA